MGSLMVVDLKLTVSEGTQYHLTTETASSKYKQNKGRKDRNI